MRLSKVLTATPSFCSVPTRTPSGQDRVASRPDFKINGLAPTAVPMFPNPGTGTTAYADPDNQLTGILLTQVGMSTPDSARLIHDFWTTLYQAIDH